MSTEEASDISAEIIGAGKRPYRRRGGIGEKRDRPRRRRESGRRRGPLFWVGCSGGVLFVALMLLALNLKSLAAWAAHAWIVDELPQPADAIVVLAGSIDSRPQAAADLYQAGYAPRIIITVTPSGGFMTPGEDIATHVILNRGVPKEAFEILTTPVRSTYDEAVSVAAWAREHGATRLLVVTDPFHTRRARWAFKRVCTPYGIEVTTVAAPPLDYSIDRWWENEFSLVEFPNDVMKYILYRFKY
ncbi:MAG: YdcF family protein [Verrucomicrobia bacterium]|nr:MAG: YdcF family protein [Verrucomicrobiota bacterium]